MANVMKVPTASIYRLLVGLLLTAITTAHCLAAPSLPGGILRDLESVEQDLAAADGSDDILALENRALSQAKRLAGGNDADRWARALYLQLASQAAVRRDAYDDAAKHIATARGVRGVDAAMQSRWQHWEASLRLRAGQQAKGAELLKAWLDEHSGEADDYWRLANAQARLKRWSSAAATLEKLPGALSDAAADQEPLSESRMMLAASIYQHAGEDEKALTMIERLLAGASHDEATWRRAAGLAQRLGRDAHAAALWEAGWRQGVLSGEAALERRIRLHLQAGTPARAAELLANALDEGALDDTLARRRLLARAYERARARSSALEAWRQVAKQSGEAEDWLYLGQLAAQWGKDPDANQALSRAQSLGSEQAAAWLDYLDQHPLEQR